MTSLKGKTLFVSGGSRGIGLAIALRAARHSLPPLLGDVEGAVDADPLWLVPERVDIGCASGLSRERNQRERRNNGCGD